MTPVKRAEAPSPPAGAARAEAVATSELLLLPDGTVLVHNLTSACAELLSQLNPADEQIRSRVIGRPPRNPPTESGG